MNRYQNAKYLLSEYANADINTATLAYSLKSIIRTINTTEKQLKEYPYDDEAIIKLDKLRKEKSDIETQLILAISSIDNTVDRVLALVESIPNPEARFVIKDHYLNNKLLQDIADTYHFSLSKVKYLNNQGLQFIESQL